jgi:hypothetical protein
MEARGDCAKVGAIPRCARRPKRVSAYGEGMAGEMLDSTECEPDSRAAEQAEGTLRRVVRDRRARRQTAAGLVVDVGNPA